MTIERFHLLTMPQQHYYSMKCGVYLSARHEKQFSAYLFQLPGYYAELFYEHGEMDCSFIRAFKATHHLEPYLSTISIEELLSL